MSVLVDDIVVSPVESTPDGVEASLSEAGLSIIGALFGDSVKKGTLVRTSVGMVMVDREPEMRTITLKLMVREDSEVTLAEAAHNLEVIVGELQERDNWIRRDFHRTGKGFEPVLYHVSGEVTLSDFLAWQVGASPDVTLTLVCDFAAYSTEEVEAGPFESAEGDRQLIYELPASDGTTKGLKRIRATNEGEEDLRGLIWAEECLDYKPEDPTAEMVYEAKDLTPKGGAEVKTVEGVEVVQHNALTAGRLAILGSEIVGVGHMTHRGPRKVWMRLEQSTGEVGDVKLQLLWRPLGSSRWVEDNPIVSPYVVGDYCLLDLGVCRPQEARVGDERWESVLVAWAPGGSGTIRIWDVYPLPTEQYLECAEPYEAPAAEAQSVKSPGTVADDSGVGTLEWTSDNNAKVQDGSYALCTNTGSSSAVAHYEKATNFGFALPEDAQVVGLLVELRRKYSGADNVGVKDQYLRLVKEGVVQATGDKGSGLPWGKSAETLTLGGSNDLWGQAWTYSEINDSGFGFAVAPLVGPKKGATNMVAEIDSVAITVYYTEDIKGEDYVCAATRSIELATDGVMRQAREGDAWGRVVPDGFLPYDSPGGLGEKPSRGILIPSQGDLGALPDSGSNSLTAVAKTRAGHLYSQAA